MSLQDLGKPFPEKDIEWRIMQAGEGAKGLWAKVAAYVDARAIMARLDEALGPANWQVEYKPIDGGMLCGISVRVETANGVEWVTKWDGSQNSDIEAVKGGISGALKRAAVLWGVGRYLYDLGEQFAIIGPNGENYASTKDKKSGKNITFNWDPPPLSKDFLPEGAKARPRPKKEDAKRAEETPPEKPVSKFVQTAADMAGVPADYVTKLSRLETKDAILKFVDEVKAAGLPEPVTTALIASARAKWPEAK